MLLPALGQTALLALKHFNLILQHLDSIFLLYDSPLIKGILRLLLKLKDLPLHLPDLPLLPGGLILQFLQARVDPLIQVDPIFLLPPIIGNDLFHLPR